MAVVHPVVKVDAGKQEVCWLSLNRLLMVTTKQETSMTTQSYWKGYAEELNIRTGVRTRLSGLTKQFNRTQKFPMMGPGRFEMSPDGTWLLWETPAWGDGWPCPHAAHLDGSHYRKWDRSRYEERFCLDSHHLVQLTEHDPMMVRDLLHPKKDREYPNAAQAKAILARYAAQQPSFLVAPYSSSEIGADGDAGWPFAARSRKGSRVASWPLLCAVCGVQRLDGSSAADIFWGRIETEHR